MVFVNRVANIVHYATNMYAGAANKNVGDAFLLVWRLTEQETQNGVDNGIAEVVCRTAGTHATAGTHPLSLCKPSLLLSQPQNLLETSLIMERQLMDNSL